MKRGIYLFIVFAALGGDTKGKVCYKEQECHWENFKKICTRVTVCR
jgi:hypothetical protein